MKMLAIVGLLAVLSVKSYAGIKLNMITEFPVEYSTSGIGDTTITNVGGSTRGPLAQDSLGRLYGSTFSHGANGGGFVFRVNPTSGAFENLHSFTSSEGMLSSGGLYGTGSVFYGACSAYGLSNYGSIFSIDTNGSFQTILPFKGTNGNGPAAAPLVLGNRLFGTTYQGGSNNLGTIYIVSNSVITWSYSLNSTIGSGPKSRPAVGADGKLYIPCTGGGLYGAGSILRLDLSNLSLTNIHSFTNSTDGGSPTTTLTLMRDGNLYGTTWAVNAYGDGTIYRLQTNGNTTTIFTFHESGAAVSAQEVTVGPEGDMGAWGTFGYGAGGHEAVIYRINLDGSGFVEVQEIEATAQGYANALTLGLNDNIFYFALRYNPEVLMSLSAPVTPQVIRLESLSCESNRITFTSVAGQDYKAHSTGDLRYGVTNAGTVTATSNLTSFVHSVTNGMNFNAASLVDEGPQDYWQSVKGGYVKLKTSYAVSACLNNLFTSGGGSGTNVPGFPRTNIVTEIK